MKKLLCIVCAALLLLSLCACGKTEVSLCDRGMEVIGLMSTAIRSEEYLDLMSASPSLREKIDAAAAGDYTVPQAVYAITFPGNALDGIGPVPEELKDLVSDRMISALAAQINAAGGAETLATATICTVGKTFVSTELAEDSIYLYVFSNGCPVAVTFTTGEDHTVSATSNIILYEDFPCENVEELQEFLGEFAKVTEITAQ